MDRTPKSSRELLERIQRLQSEQKERVFNGCGPQTLEDLGFGWQSQPLSWKDPCLVHDFLYSTESLGHPLYCDKITRETADEWLRKDLIAQDCPLAAEMFYRAVRLFGDEFWRKDGDSASSAGSAGSAGSAARCEERKTTAAGAAGHSKPAGLGHRQCAMKRALKASLGSHCSAQLHEHAQCAHQKFLTSHEYKEHVKWDQHSRKRRPWHWTDLVGGRTEYERFAKASLLAVAGVAVAVVGTVGVSVAILRRLKKK